MLSASQYQISLSKLQKGNQQLKNDSQFEQEQKIKCVAFGFPNWLL
jgi:hypothetical protein